MSDSTHNYIFPKRTAEQLEQQLSGAASMVKLACGVGNNAAYAVMLTAHDYIKMHPNYRHEVKRLYRQAFTMFRQREGQLLHRSQNRFFHVADVWGKALTLTDPKADTYDLNEGEKRNIQLGLEQLEELWANPKFLYSSAFTATEDFEDIFRTKGENKKALREIGEIMQEAEERM